MRGSRAGRYARLGCGGKTRPVPAEEAAAYLRPVCCRKDDVLIDDDREAGDENGGIPLRKARQTHQKIGACRERLLPYVRKPRQEELS